MEPYTPTRWEKLDRFGGKTRGHTLIRKFGSVVLGHAEPYRGGGPKFMANGIMEYSRGWWVTVEGLDPLSYKHRVKTKQEARKLIERLYKQRRANNADDESKTGAHRED